MKKIISLILSLVMVLSFTACGTKAEATWQEHYDLGLKYVNEAKYEEAILSFTKALEIDPKQAPVYIALAEVYVRQENYSAAQLILDKIIKETLNENFNEELSSWSSIIPPRAEFAPKAEEVNGVVKVEGRYGYDINGNRVCRSAYSDGKLTQMCIYTYNAEGKEIRRDSYDYRGTLIGSIVSLHLADGTMVLEGNFNPDGTLISYNVYSSDGTMIYYQKIQ